MISSKEQERKALEQIRKIVDGLGSDSYLAAAFAGCFEDAEQNIENDFALCWKDRAESASKVIEEMKKDQEELSFKLDQKEKSLEIARFNYATAKKNAEQLNDWYFDEKQKNKDYEARINSQAQEILKLKARLYDALVEGNEA